MSICICLCFPLSALLYLSPSPSIQFAWHTLFIFATHVTEMKSLKFHLKPIIIVYTPRTVGDIRKHSYCFALPSGIHYISFKVNELAIYMSYMVDIPILLYIFDQNDNLECIQNGLSFSKNVLELSPPINVNKLEAEHFGVSLWK